MVISTNHDLTQKVLLLVNTGSIKKKFIIQRLRSLGVKLVAVNKEKNWADPYVEQWIFSDTLNHSETIQNIRTFMVNNPEIKIDGVLTFWEDDVLLTAKIADRFNFIGIPHNIAKKVRNKYLFREVCRSYNLPTPQYKLIRKLDDLKAVKETFHFPLVIKPVYGSSSAYVIKVENEEELDNTFNYVKENISPTVESALADGLEILVEEYIDGDEVDIDMLLQNGKVKFYSITDNYKTNEPFFIETGFAIPSNLPAQDKIALAEMAEETLEKLGVQNGCLHFEAKSTKNGPVPIEINLRMGGDEVYSFIKGAWGVDLIENAVNIATGIHLKINKPPTPKKYFAGQDFLSDHSGILVKVNIDERIKKENYLQELYFYKEIGDPVLVPPEGYEYLGWLTVSGDNLLDAQDNLQQALKYINYEVKKFATDSAFGRTSRKNRFSSAVLNKDLVIRAAKIEHIKRLDREHYRNTHIGLGCNLYSEEEGEAAKQLTQTIKLIEQTLKERGYQVTIFNFNNLNKVFDELKKSDVDLLFNLVTPLNQPANFQANLPAFLELMQIPYTGSNSLTVNLASDKISFKKLLNYHKIPTPAWDYAYSLEDAISEELLFPLIVKPAISPANYAITAESVVTAKEQLNQQIKRITVELNSPVLVEKYIEGDEYQVAILGTDPEDLEVLPLARLLFKNLPQESWHIITSAVKANGQAKEAEIIVQLPPKNISKKLESLITEIALDTYNILDCRDYGLVVVKVDSDNNPYVLELATNPSLAGEAHLPQAAKLVNMDYGDLLEEIIIKAIKRYQSEPSII